MVQSPEPNTGIQAWIRRNPGVTLSFVVIAIVSLSAFLYFFTTAR
ncbi:MAG: hypothetical protein AAF268_00070 [Cyanobacteria bacterium P01_A01_bin.3]